MPVDIKGQIAKKAIELIREGKTKKLTVKDIVEACNITRQTFYYHFDDVPQLFEWIIRKEKDRLLSYSTDDVEEGIRLFFVSAINVLPYMHRTMQTNYRDEFEHILFFLAPRVSYWHSAGQDQNTDSVSGTVFPVIGCAVSVLAKCEDAESSIRACSGVTADLKRDSWPVSG